MRFALVAALAAGCYSPSIHDGQYTCKQGVCPSGFVCACGLCVSATDGGACSPDLAVVDEGAAVDLAPAPPCSNGGQRAPADPGLARLAICPAAWTVPGTTSPDGLGTPCNRQPTANGTSAVGVHCSAEDNCGPGWHVCDSEKELTDRGFTAVMCKALDNAAGNLWVTRQIGAPPPPTTDGGMPMGPPVCGGDDRTVFGCGALASPANCSLLTRVLVTGPMGGNDRCSQDTGGAFTCAGVSMTMPESKVVLKTALPHGGVFCCAD